MFAGFTFGVTARGFFIPAAAFFGGMVVAGGGGVECERWRGRGGQGEERRSAGAGGALGVNRRGAAGNGGVGGEIERIWENRQEGVDVTGKGARASEWRCREVPTMSI
jgi:hypothetical protein